MILVDMLLAISLAALFVSIIAESSLGARDLFYRARDREEAIDSASSTDHVLPYGNDRLETDRALAPKLSFTEVRAYPYIDLREAAGTPLCSADFLHGNAKAQISIAQINLPINMTIPLTDLEIRNGIAYVAADSNVAADPDLFILDIRDPDAPRLLSSISTGPGISAIALAGKRIFAAADSTAAQLHVIRIDSLASLALEAKFKLPLPYATATAPMAASIFYGTGKIYLGTTKWDGDEFDVIDVSNTVQPVKLGGFETNTKVNGIYVRNSIAYAASADQSQLRLIDIHDPTHPSLFNAFSPSGWQRQEGQVVDYFEDAVSFGRTSGGFDIPADHEAFTWATSSKASLMNPWSVNGPGGIYGIVTDRTHLFLGTRQTGKEFQIFSRSLLASMTYPLPASVRSMTCDNDSIYALGRAAPVVYRITFN